MGQNPDKQSQESMLPKSDNPRHALLSLGHITPEMIAHMDNQISAVPSAKLQRDALLDLLKMTA